MKKYVDKDALQDFATKLHTKQKTIFATKGQVGTPLVASLVADMTDQTKIYVYVGSESGYTAGNWYYYDGSAWTSGGVYNSAAVQTDDTLSVEGMAADAKATGDAISALDNDISTIAEDYVTSVEMAEAIEGNIDATLSVEGKAADAAIVGNINNRFIDVENIVNYQTKTTCVLADGSITNPSNTNGVNTTTKIPCKYGDTVEFYPVRPNTDGYNYIYAFAVYDLSDRLLSYDSDAKPIYKKINITDLGASHIRFAIFETNGTNFIQLRSSNYGYTPYAMTISSNAKDHISDIENSLLSVLPSKVSVGVQNGTISNPSNVNAVSTSFVQCKYGDTVEFYPVRPNTDGYHYLYGYSVYDSNGNLLYGITDATENAKIVRITNASADKIRFFVVESDGSIYNPLRESNYGYVPYIIAYDGSTIEEKVESIESDITNFNNFSEIIYIGEFLNNVDWEQGTLDSGLEVPAINRIRTADFIEIGYSSEFSIKITSGYKYALHFYDVNKKPIWSSSSWQTTDATYTNNDFDGAGYLKVVLCNSSNSVINPTEKTNTSGDMVRFSNYATDYLNRKLELLISDQDFKHYDDLLSQARFSPTDNAKVLTLMHFSDVHGNLVAMEKAINLFETYSDKIDDMIHTGDVVVANWSDGIGNWVDSGCAESVISVVGNHDSEENLILGTAGKENVYNGMLAPYISNWNVVQPTGVDDPTSNYYCACYYYKDYTDASIRLIVLDVNWWDSYEKVWLADVLDDALNNNYSVIIGCHTPLRVTGITAANFCSYTEPIINEPSAYANIPSDWLEPVGDFIGDGGEVICMLAGHNHRDHIGYLTDYPDVLCITADKASVARTIDSARITGENNATAFNIITFNPTDKWIKIVRIGAEVDGQMRGKHVFCYDYENKQIVSQW